MIDRSNIEKREKLIQFYSSPISKSFFEKVVKRRYRRCAQKTLELIQLYMCKKLGGVFIKRLTVQEHI